MTDDLAPKPRAPLPDHADPISDPPSVSTLPGRLIGASWMTVRTRQAQRLAYGRRGGTGRPPIVGLFRFGWLATYLWQRAEYDDPYADWTLLRIEDGIEDGRKRLRQIGVRMRELLDSVEGFRFEVADTNQPIHMPLRFTNAYGYHAAQLVYECDEAMRAILTARHVGLIGRDEADRIEYQAGNAVRSVLEQPAAWIDRAAPRDRNAPPRSGIAGVPMLPGCTRRDVSEATADAALMHEHLGDCPADVVAGRRPRLAPAVRRRFVRAAQIDRKAQVEEPGTRAGEVQGDTSGDA